MKRWYLAAAVVAGLAGCGGTTHSTRTVIETVVQQAPLTPRPGAVAAPAREAPACTAQQVAEVEAGKGRLGVCAPKPLGFKLAPPRIGRGSTGPDLSNNNPVSDWRAVRRHGHEFAYLKVNQGTGFVDRTARAMAAGARAAHVTPGGYDFLEVCRGSATGEAELFARLLAADGLLRSPAFVPMGDAEWPLSVPCSAAEARSWLERWQEHLHALIHRWAGFYTGAWWANPNLGCWRPPHGALRWISGYVARRNLTIPCGWGTVDLWQFSDHAFNGAASDDMSVLEVSASKFLGGSGPTPAQRRAAKLASLRSHETERGELHVVIDRHHCRPGPPWYGHASPRSYHTVCGHWLTRGGQVIKVIDRLRRELHLKGG